MRHTLLRFPDFKNKALTLSYDDGVLSDKKLINIIDKYGIKCTFNLNSGLLSDEHTDRRMNKNEAVSLYKDTVHEVAVHGFKHLSLPDVGSAVGAFDVIEDRKNLEFLFGKIINGLAYPFGTYNDDVVNMLKSCGIKYARTVVSTEQFDIPSDFLRWHPTCHHKNPKLMQLADEFLQDSKSWFMHTPPKLFYLWGHSYEFDNDNNWEIIENFAKKVGNRDDIWYCTNIELCDYVKAYENLEYSVDRKIVKNNSGIDLYVCYFGKEIIIKANSVMAVEI